jgi:hypothetical protein
MLAPSIAHVMFLSMIARCVTCPADRWWENASQFDPVSAGGTVWVGWVLTLIHGCLTAILLWGRGSI